MLAAVILQHNCYLPAAAAGATKASFPQLASTLRAELASTHVGVHVLSPGGHRLAVGPANLVRSVVRVSQGVFNHAVTGKHKFAGSSALLGPSIGRMVGDCLLSV